LDQEIVLAALRSHADSLREAGVLHLRLHGSVARGQASGASDVHLIADIDGSKRLSLFDLAALEHCLTDLLGRPVDLSLAHMLKDAVRERAAREGVVAF
jgi:predicted nucleotidyltransferase